MHSVKLLSRIIISIIWTPINFDCFSCISLLSLAEFQFAISAVPRAVYFRVNYQEIKSAGQKKKKNVDKCVFSFLFLLTVFNVTIETLLDGNICQWFTLILLTLTGRRGYSGVRKRTADIISPIFWVELDWASAPASIMNLQKKMDQWPLCMYVFFLINFMYNYTTFVESLSAAADSEDHVTVWVIFFLFI